MIHIAPVIAVLRRVPGQVWALLAGLFLGWWLWHPRTIVEPPAPAVQLQTGGQVLERAPEAPVPSAAAEDARAAGGRLERAISITVQPRPVSSAPPEPTPPRPPGNVQAEAAPAPPCSCEDVTVDLGLIRMPDGTRRVTARARGGELLGGVDVPVISRAPARVARWAAGLTVSVDMSQRRALGAFVDRDLGPLRLGFEVSQRDGGTATLRAGIKF